MKKSLFLFIAFFISSNLLATTVTWTGSKSSNWHEKDNWSTTSIPEAGDDVIIAQGSNVCIKNDSDYSEYNSVKVESNGSLTITSDTPLYISGQSIRGLHILGSVTNHGVLAVFDHEGDGIIIAGGTLTNHKDVIVQNMDAFSTANGKGIECDGTLTNNDEIDISATESYGLELLGTLHNNGNIKINDGLGSTPGIYNEGTFNNNSNGDINITDYLQSHGLESDGAFNNNGSISIHNVTNHGLYNTGNFVNGANSSIAISTIDNNGVFTQRSIGLFNESTFTLHHTSTLTITDIEASGAAFATGIQTDGTFNGNGRIVIDSLDGGSSYGIYNESNFSFSGDSLLINLIRDINDDTNGLWTISNLSISAGAVVQIKNARNGVQSLNSGSLITNNGRLNINDVSTQGIVNDGTFNNSNIINVIGFSNQNGTNGGIDNNGTFNNLTNGFIYIDDDGASDCPQVTCPISIGVINDSKFLNQGVLLGTNLVQGYVGDHLTNSGNILINEAYIINQNVLINSGNIQVTDALYGIRNMDSLVNESGGSILIDSTTASNGGYGIGNELTARLVNDGKITINKSTSEGIRNQGTIINSDSIIIDNSYRVGIGTQFYSPTTQYADTSIVNNSQGVIIIQNMSEEAFSEHALENFSLLINDGEIFIDEFESINPAIYNDGNIKNNGSLSTDNLDNGNLNRNFEAFRNTTQGTLTNGVNGVIDFKTGYVLNQNRITNNGTFKISENLSDGFTNQDTFINNKEFICDSSYLTNEGYLENNDLLDFHKGAITNNGKLVNNEDIKVVLTKIGISNTDTLINSNSSSIILDTMTNNGLVAESFGLYNQVNGYVSNSGSIQVKNVDWGGVNNNGLIDNLDGSSMSVLNSPRHSIVNQDSFYVAPFSVISVDNITFADAVSNLGSWVNEGNMNVTNCERWSISSSGLFENKGGIYINSAFSDSSFSSAIKNSGMFTNFMDGIILIQNIFGSDPAIENSGNFVNQNEITLNRIEPSGIDNSGTFSNQDEILIQETQGQCISNSNSFTNLSSGRIEIKNFSNVKLTTGGISNSGSWVNNGFVDIVRVLFPSSSAFTNSGSFVNTDTLKIVDCKYGFRNFASIPNVNDGVILIEAAQDFGFSTAGHFTNNNLIILDQNYDYGWYYSDTVVNNGSIIINQGSESGLYSNTGNSLLMNNTDASISLSNVKNGIYLRGNFSGPDTARMKNMGTININSAYEKAIFADHDSRVDNYDSLIINNSFSGIYNTTYFENHSGGHIQMDTIHGTGSLGYAIRNEEIFKNNSCAKIEFEGAINNNNFADLFMNDGILMQYATIANVFSQPITNNGIYVNVLGATTDILQMSNIGMYIEPISVSYSCGDTIQDFYIGQGMNLSGTDIYSDSLANNTAGAMEIPNRRLIIDNSVQITGAIWADIMMNGCTQRIPIPIENPISANCPPPLPCGTNTWTGNGADNDWFTTGNWSLGVIPEDCHEVILPNGTTCTIPSGMTGECKFIEVALGINFEVQGLLNVYGN